MANVRPKLKILNFSKSVATICLNGTKNNNNNNVKQFSVQKETRTKIKLNS